MAQLVEPLMQHSWQEFLNQHVQALLVEILHSAAQAPDWGGFPCGKRAPRHPSTRVSS